MVEVGSLHLFKFQEMSFAVFVTGVWCACSRFAFLSPLFKQIGLFGLHIPRHTHTHRSNLSIFDFLKK